MPFDPKVHVGVSAMLTRRHCEDCAIEVLMLKRAATNPHGGGTWALPGGWLDFGDTPAEAAARELAEELNVKVNPKRPGKTLVVTNTYEDAGMHVVCVNIEFSTYDDREIDNMEPEKCDGYEWVPIHQVKDRRLFPATRLIAKKKGWLRA